MAEQFSEINESGSPHKFLVIPIHSSIPVEEQTQIFQKNDDVKIILATNAAESSITLPDVDHGNA